MLHRCLLLGIVVQSVSPQLNLLKCITPNQESGWCTPLQLCAFLNISKTETLQFIKASQCEGRLQLYCCGTKGNFDAPSNSRNTPERIQSPVPEEPFPKDCGVVVVDRVTFGVEAELGDFPWLGRLRHKRQDDRFSYGCVAFLISNRFVITAAHCVLSAALAPLGPIYDIEVGDHNFRTNPDCEDNRCAEPVRQLRTDNPIVHPDFSNDSQLYNDIALIPLKGPVTFSKYVAPICLPKRSTYFERGWVAGWGVTETGQASDVKLKTRLDTVNHTDCAERFRKIGIFLTSAQICAGGKFGRDTCAGDSGGPLMRLIDEVWHAEGIVSFGKGCGERGWPGVYTNLAYYLDWIKSNVQRYLNKL